MPKALKMPKRQTTKMQKTMAAAPKRLALTLSLLLCAFPFAAAELGPIAARHESGGAVVQMEPRMLSGTPYVAVKDMEALFEDERSPALLRSHYSSSTRRLSIQLRTPSVGSMFLRLKMGSPSVQIGAKESIEMRSPAVEIAGEPWAPLQLWIEGIPKAIPAQIEYNEETRELIVRAGTAPAEPAPEEPTPVPEPPASAPYLLLELEAPVWTGLKVAVDAGHGGADAGLTKSGAVEKELTLALAKRIKTAAALTRGFVFLTRADDAARTLEERLQAAERGGASAFISLHFNDSISSARRGYRMITLASPASSADGTPADAERMANESEKLADAVEGALKEAGFEGKRLQLPLPALERANRPALLIEMAYLSNAEEAAYWRLPQTAERAAAAIWNGAARYKP